MLPTLASEIKRIVGEKSWQVAPTSATTTVIRRAIEQLPEVMSGRAEGSARDATGNGAWKGQNERLLAAVLFGFRNDLLPQSSDLGSISYDFDYLRLACQISAFKSKDDRNFRRMRAIIREDLAYILIEMKPDAAGRSLTSDLLTTGLEFLAGLQPRPDYLQQLDDAIVATRHGGPVVWDLYGPGGYGKTTLAGQWARHIHKEHADMPWCLIDLKGFGDKDAVKVNPSGAYERLCAALGLPAERELDDDTSAIKFRKLAAERRMLVILDNVADVHQVRPLLPRDEPYVVLITSRSLLHGLQNRGVTIQPIRLELMSPKESVAVLKRNIKDRLAYPESALTDLAAYSCGLPRALRCIASIIDNEIETATELARNLARTGAKNSHHERLSRTDEDENFQKIFTSSYGHLTPTEQRIFRMVSPRLGHGIDPYTIGVLADARKDQAEQTAFRFAQVGLVERTTGYRFNIHDLLREFARDQCSDDEVPEATERLLASYYGCVNHAFNHENPNNRMIDHAYLADWDGIDAAEAWMYPPSQVDGCTGRNRTGEWFARERACLVDLVKSVCDSDTPPALAPRLAYSLFYLLERGNYWSDWRDVTDAGLSALERLDDPSTRGLLLRNKARLAWIDVRGAHDRLRLTPMDDQERQAHQDACRTALKLYGESIDMLERDCALPGVIPVVRREIGDVHLQLAKLSPIGPDRTNLAAAECAYLNVKQSLTDDANAMASLCVSLGELYTLMGDPHSCRKAHDRLNTALSYALAPTEDSAYTHPSTAGHGRVKLGELLAHEGKLDQAAEAFDLACDAFGSFDEDGGWIHRARALVRKADLLGSLTGRDVAQDLQNAEAVLLAHESPEADAVTSRISRLTV